MATTTLRLGPRWDQSRLGLELRLRDASQIRLRDESKPRIPKRLPETAVMRFQVVKKKKQPRRQIKGKPSSTTSTTTTTTTTASNSTTNAADLVPLLSKVLRPCPIRQLTIRLEDGNHEEYHHGTQMQQEESNPTVEESLVVDCLEVLPQLVPSLQSLTLQCCPPCDVQGARVLANFLKQSGDASVAAVGSSSSLTKLTLENMLCGQKGGEGEEPPPNNESTVNLEPSLRDVIALYGNNSNLTEVCLRNYHFSSSNGDDDDDNDNSLRQWLEALQTLRNLQHLSICQGSLQLDDESGSRKALEQLLVLQPQLRSLEFQELSSTTSRIDLSSYNLHNSLLKALLVHPNLTKLTLPLLHDKEVFACINHGVSASHQLLRHCLSSRTPLETLHLAPWVRVEPISGKTVMTVQVTETLHYLAEEMLPFWHRLLVQEEQDDNKWEWDSVRLELKGVSLQTLFQGILNNYSKTEMTREDLRAIFGFNKQRDDLGLQLFLLFLEDYGWLIQLNVGLELSEQRLRALLPSHNREWDPETDAVPTLIRLLGDPQHMTSLSFESYDDVFDTLAGKDYFQSNVLGLFWQHFPRLTYLAFGWDRQALTRAPALNHCLPVLFASLQHNLVLQTLDLADCTPNRIAFAHHVPLLKVAELNLPFYCTTEEGLGLWAARLKYNNFHIAHIRGFQSDQEDRAAPTTSNRGSIGGGAPFVFGGSSGGPSLNHGSLMQDVLSRNQRLRRARELSQADHLMQGQPALWPRVLRHLGSRHVQNNNKRDGTPVFLLLTGMAEAVAKRCGPKAAMDKKRPPLEHETTTEKAPVDANGPPSDDSLLHRPHKKRKTVTPSGH